MPSCQLLEGEDGVIFRFKTIHNKFIRIYLERYFQYIEYLLLLQDKIAPIAKQGCDSYLT